MTVIAIVGVAAIVVSYTCCKISHKEDELTGMRMKAMVFGMSGD